MKPPDRTANRLLAICRPSMLASAVFAAAVCALLAYRGDVSGAVDAGFVALMALGAGRG